MMNKKICALLLMFMGVSSCGSEDPNNGLLTIAVVPSQAAIVPTERRSCIDIYQDVATKSVGSSSVGFSSGQLTWNDTTRDLFIVKVQLDLENTIVGTKIDITDPDELSRLFGIGTTAEVKIPRKGAVGASATGVYKTDFKDLNNDRVMDTGQKACPLAFGGMSLPEDTEVVVSGHLRFLGVTQNDSGDQEVVRASTPVSLIISTD